MKFHLKFRKMSLPRGINNIPRNLHLLGCSLIQFFQTTRQCSLYSRRFSWRIRRAFADWSSKWRKNIIAKHTSRKSWRAGAWTPHVTHPSKRTWKPEKLGKYIFGIPRIEPKRRRWPTRKPARTRWRHLALQTFLSVLIIHRSFLWITQNLKLTSNE